LYRSQLFLVPSCLIGSMFDFSLSHRLFIAHSLSPAPIAYRLLLFWSLPL
jgi:hypothetical protein